MKTFQQILLYLLIALLSFAHAGHPHVVNQNAIASGGNAGQVLQSLNVRKQALCGIFSQHYTLSEIQGSSKPAFLTQPFYSLQSAAFTCLKFVSGQFCYQLFRYILTSQEPSDLIFPFHTFW